MAMSPRAAQTVYQVGVIATSIVALAGIWRGLDGETTSALGNLITAVLGLLGVGATATAHTRVSRQRQDGTLDFSGPAAQQAIDAINAVNSQAATASADLDKVRDALGGIAATIPVVGPLAQQVIAQAGR